MTEVVGQGDRLGQVVVEAQGVGDGARDLRHFQRMGQPGAEVVALVGDEHLGLLLKAAEGGAVDDAVAIPREGGASETDRLGVYASTRPRRILGIGREAVVLCRPRGQVALPSRPFRYRGLDRI